jgi:hypothetical protein
VPPWRVAGQLYFFTFYIHSPVVKSVVSETFCFPLAERLLSQHLPEGTEEDNEKFLSRKQFHGLDSKLGQHKTSQERYPLHRNF